jgi:hypothetical protein
MEKLQFPLLATGTCDRDHIFLRITQKVGTENICAFDRLNPKQLWSAIGLWASGEINFYLKQDLSVADEMKQQDCRYFLFRFKNPLTRVKIEQIIFGAEREIINICDILDIETEERPWILFQALFGKYLIRVFPRRDWQSNDLSLEEVEELRQAEMENSPNLVALARNEFTYNVDETEAEGKEKVEIHSWEALEGYYSKQSNQEVPFSKTEVEIKKHISYQQTSMDKEKTRLKSSGRLGTQHRTEWFKSKTQIQTIFERFNFNNSEKLKSSLDGWDHKKKFGF